MILIPDWLNSFLTPIFLIGLGAILGLLVLLLLWGCLAIVARSAAAAVPRMVKEGPLLWLLWVVVAFVVLGLVTGMVVFDRQTILTSLIRWPATGTRVAQVQIEPPPDALVEPKAVEVRMPFLGDELAYVWVRSNEPLELSTPPDENGVPRVSFDVEPNEETPRYNRNRNFAGMQVGYWVVKNVGDEVAHVSIEMRTQPEHPEVRAVGVTAAGVILAFLFYALHAAFFKKTSAVALAASKSEMAHPLYLVLLIAGVALLVLFIFIPYFTLGEDIKVLKDSGLVLIVTFCVFHTVLAASNQVSDEIEGKTALTVLSKPIGRTQFILGKMLGIAWTEFVLTTILGAVFLVVIAYKTVYDSGETASELPTWQTCYREIAQTVPGLALAFFETLVFAAVSIAIATRLPLMANFVICFAVFALGHLTPQIVQSGLNKFEAVDFIGKLIATVLPVLDYFNVYAGIAGGARVPPEYLGMAAVYCALYCSVAILLALALFDDRDLA